VCAASRADYRSSHLGDGTEYDRALAHGDFNSYMTDVEGRLLRSLVPRLFGGRPFSYVDFACGTGRITRVVEPLAEVAYGIDVSAAMLAEARRKCVRTTFIEHDLTRRPLALPPVQLVSAFRFMGCAQDELRVEALSAISRLLVPGGYLVVNNHKNAWAPRHTLPVLRGRPPIGDLSYLGLRRHLERAGMRVVRSYGIGVWVVRAALDRPAMLFSRRARALERLSNVPFLAPFAPDIVVLARKRGP
jgi:SAM-dependent methyltransferase